jgi:hypothetical protein
MATLTAAVGQGQQPQSHQQLPRLTPLLLSHQVEEFFKNTARADRIAGAAASGDFCVMVTNECPQTVFEGTHYSMRLARVQGRYDVFNSVCGANSQASRAHMLALVEKYFKPRVFSGWSRHVAPTIVPHHVFVHVKRHDVDEAEAAETAPVTPQNTYGTHISEDDGEGSAANNHVISLIKQSSTVPFITLECDSVETEARLQELLTVCDCWRRGLTVRVVAAATEARACSNSWL